MRDKLAHFAYICIVPYFLQCAHFIHKRPHGVIRCRNIQRVRIVKTRCVNVIAAKSLRQGVKGCHGNATVCRFRADIEGIVGNVTVSPRFDPIGRGDLRGDISRYHWSFGGRGRGCSCRGGLRGCRHGGRRRCSICTAGAQRKEHCQKQHCRYNSTAFHLYPSVHKMCFVQEYGFDEKCW